MISTGKIRKPLKEKQEFRLNFVSLLIQNGKGINTNVSNVI